jgi:MFS family permease
MAGVGALGVAAAAPLGGVLTQFLGWRAVFALSAAAGLLAPYALRVLPKREPQSGDRLDLLGGALLGLAVGGALLAMTQASRGAWGTPHVVAAAIGSVVAAVLLVLRQRRARSPFVPRELLRNRRYVLLTAIAFLVATGDLVVLTGVPLALVEVGEASAAQVGLALLPGSLLPILLTPPAGRLVDRIGASVPIVTGIIAMLGGTLLLSITGGVPLGGTAALFALQAAGIAILGPTIIATVSLVVPPRVLNTAIGLTEMSFYLGAGSGTALVTAVLAAREGTERAINPLHTGAAPAYSDAFLVAVLPLLVALAFALAFAGSGRLAAAVEPSP